MMILSRRDRAIGSEKSRYYSFRLAWCAAALAPAALIVALIGTRGVDMPFYDEWFATLSVDVAIRAADHTLKWVDLLTQNFEHRIFFSQLLSAVLGWTGIFDTRLEMLASVVLCFGGLVALLAILRQQLPDRWYWMILPFSGVLFSLRQQNNWLWGFETPWYFGFFFFAASLAVVALLRVRLRVLPLAAFGCLCASFSFGSGLLTWPLVGIALWLRGYRKPAFVIAWLALMVSGLMTFFHGYQWMPSHSSHYATAMLWNAFLYIANFAGTALISSQPADRGQLTLGFTLIAYFVFASWQFWRRGESERLAPWFALGSYTIGSAALVAFSTRAPAWNAPIAGRYVTNTLMLLVANLALGILRWNRSRSSLEILGGVMIAGLFLYSSVLAWPQPSFLMTPAKAACLSHLVETDNTACISDATDRPHVVEERLYDLARLRLSGMRSAPVRRLTIAEPSGARLNLEPQRSDLWLHEGFDPYPGRPTTFLLFRGGSFHRDSLDWPLKDDDVLVLDLRVAKRIRERELHVYYTSHPSEEYIESMLLRIALRWDGEKHRYVIPLRWLKLKPGSHLSKLRFGIQATPQHGGEVEFAGVWLVQSKGA